MKIWKILLTISLEEIELLSHDCKKFVNLSFFMFIYIFVLNFITLLLYLLLWIFSWKLTRVCVFDWFTRALIYFVLLVVDYIKKNLGHNMLWKESATNVFETCFWWDQKTAKWFLETLRMKNNEWLSQITKWIQMFLHGFDKQQFSKH